MAKYTILLVDDQKINRTILSNLLKEDYEILEASDGKEALSLLHQYPDKIEAVLLDIVMPIMNGYEVLEAMAKEPSLSMIPVLVSSQKDGDEDEIKALTLGAQDFIAKPYKGDIIRHRLKNTIQFRKTASMINRAQKDELTGLFNKQFFLHKMEEVLNDNSTTKWDLFCLGVERFKLVNETYGIAKGDELLQYIAQGLLEVADRYPVGRFNADLFLMLLPHQEEKNKESLEKFIEKMNEFPIDMRIKVHCGIYPITDKTLPLGAMCDRAQLASDNNRGQYEEIYSLYDDSIRERLLEEQIILNSMQSALENEEFQVYYQPKYDLENENIAGAEALVRWIHPEKGMIPPSAFIPLFERNGFVMQLDRYVWKRACQDIASWLKAGLPEVPVSVNVSRGDVYNPKLIEFLLSLLAKFEVPIHLLHLEITESAYTDNPEQIIQVVSELRNLGFTVEMDDFGSGYSSLNMLAQMPVDILKLDMRFIQSETKKTKEKGILNFVIELAKGLDLTVIAEGVETAEQIATLRAMNCRYVQGYYYAKPMPEKDFVKLLQNSKVTQMKCISKTMEIHAEVSQKEKPKVFVYSSTFVRTNTIASCLLNDFEVIQVHSQKEVLENNQETIELFLFDDVDERNCPEWLNKWKKDCHGIVIVVSNDEEKWVQWKEKVEFDDVISEPVSSTILLNRVKESFQNRKVANQEIQNLKMSKEEVQNRMNILSLYFDIVRIVEPKNTMVYDSNLEDCELQACFSVWGKNARCNHCSSYLALQNKCRVNKLEYSSNGLFFVISEYIPYQNGAVIEMVSHLDDAYVDNIFDKELLYLNMDKINRLIEIDALTQVYNRRYIDVNLGNYLTRAKSLKKNLGIAMIDIDSFKQLNDQMGHLAGDEILKSIATMLQRNIVINKDDFVARYGGDEFLILCWDIEKDAFVKRITSVAEIIKHIQLSNNEVDSGISVGCVCTSENEEWDSRKLIEVADERLYQAKKEGRGKVVSS